MPEFHLSHWSWLILAALLLVVELLAPGTYFLWLSIAAALVGLVVLVVPGLAWEAQVLSFAVLAVVTIALSRLYLKKRPVRSDEPTLNRRGEQYVGRTFTLDGPIVNGTGKIRVDDSTWKIEGEDMPAGTHVRVVGVSGTVFRVERF